MGRTVKTLKAPALVALVVVAFVVPRSSTAINLWMRHLEPDGGYAGAEFPLLHTALN
jgi:hypothetical protein